MFKNWQVYISEVITGERKGIIAAILRFFLYILSWGFRFIVVCRNWAFDRRYFQRYSPPIPLVISIGNIVAGGTGKTPVTLMIANEFYNDYPIAILSRGYKSRAEKLSEPTILCNGEGPFHSAEHCGDEPYLLAKHLPKAIVIVGKDRFASSNMAFQAGAKVVLLDDGMQHRRLERDLEVVVINSRDAFGQGYFLPRGFLRETMDSLSRANLIIINHVTDQDQFLLTLQDIAPYSDAPAVGTKMEVDTILDCKGNTVSLQNKKVGIFCGIANPHNFEDTVKSLGADIVAHLFLSDHGDTNNEELSDFAKECVEKGAEILVCTEKDFVKLDIKQEVSLPIAWLQMKLVIVAGEENWHEFIRKAKCDLARRT